jgi:hypothetical protein
MYDQQVKWDDTKKVWTYEPVKYWPNEFGDAANSDDFDKVTFFAYAPYVNFTVNTGIPVVNDGEKADSVQKKNIVGTVKNTTSGDPFIKYIVDTDPATSVDLLWGVAAESNGYRGLNYTGINDDNNVIPGNCYIDLTKQIGTTDSIKWNFKHALAQLNIQIISAVDTATQGNDIYAPKENATQYGTNADSKIDSLTKVYLRWIEFSGFVMKGALNLHSEDVETPGVANAQPNWKGFDGTNELVIENVRFNDGLKEGKEGTTNNIQKTELPVALNPMIIEESFEAEYAKATEEQKAKMKDSWKYKKAGIPTAEYANLFATKDVNGDPASPNAADPIYVIPTGEELTIEGLYDVMTKDEKLAGLLSDNKTHGSAIENKIYKETGVVIEAGKSYIIKIVVGLESVKFSVEVTPWVESSPKENDVDLPFNPGYKAAYQDGKPLVLYLYQGTEEANLNDFKVATLFEKQFVTNVITKADTAKVDEDYKDYYYFGENFEYRVKKSDLKINTNLPEGSEDTYQISKVEKFDEANAEFTTSKTDGDTETENAYDIYFFSEKLVITADPAGSDDVIDDNDDEDLVDANVEYPIQRYTASGSASGSNEIIKTNNYDGYANTTITFNQEETDVIAVTFKGATWYFTLDNWASFLAGEKVHPIIISDGDFTEALYSVELRQN